MDPTSLKERALALSLSEFTSVEFVTGVLGSSSTGRTHLIARLASAYRVYLEKHPDLTVREFLEEAEKKKWDIRHQIRINEVGPETAKLMVDVMRKVGLYQDPISASSLSAGASLILEELKKG